MTIVDVKLTKQTETFHFNPPLPPAKEMQLMYFECFASHYGEVFCDIVDSSSHYSNLEGDKSRPTQLIAMFSCISKNEEDETGFIRRTTYVCPQKYPLVKVQRSKDPINSIKISVDLWDNIPGVYECNFRLKIHH